MNIKLFLISVAMLIAMWFLSRYLANQDMPDAPQALYILAGGMLGVILYSTLPTKARQVQDPRDQPLENFWLSNKRRNVLNITSSILLFTLGCLTHAIVLTTQVRIGCVTSHCSFCYHLSAFTSCMLCCEENALLRGYNRFRSTWCWVNDVCQ